ncbi:YolD-like family protein [Sporosarcina sp. NPDC096371]|uniref:YolD-like family protein n=1 Tax=Sporosarcina sp. NPDC096371 TaxID=3364530 RepID=UPI003830814B
MLKDRGNIKWQGMMLPEHVTKLNDWRDKTHLIKRPELSEWDLQSLQEELESAYMRQCAASVTTWCEGKESTYMGKISELDQRLNSLSIEGPFGEDKVPVKEVIKVRCLE